MGNDESRKLVLARRARFVAAALAGVAASTAPFALEGCGGETTEDKEAGPQPEWIRPKDAGKEAGPQPCLSVDADVSDPVDTGADGGEEEDAGPKPCLAPPVDP
jgi:hypothetical protein